MGTGFHTRLDRPEDEIDADEFEFLEDLEELDDLDDTELELDDLDFADMDNSDLSGVPELGMEPLGANASLGDEEDDDEMIDLDSLRGDDSDDIDVELG